MYLGDRGAGDGGRSVSRADNGRTRQALLSARPDRGPAPRGRNGSFCRDMFRRRQLLRRDVAFIRAVNDPAKDEAWREIVPPLEEKAPEHFPHASSSHPRSSRGRNSSRLVRTSSGAVPSARGGSRVATLTIPTMARDSRDVLKQAETGTVTTDSPPPGFDRGLSGRTFFGHRSLSTLSSPRCGSGSSYYGIPSKCCSYRRPWRRRIGFRQNDCLIDRWDLRRVRVPRIPAAADRRQTPWVEARDLGTVPEFLIGAGTPDRSRCRSSFRACRVFIGPVLIVMGTGLLKPISPRSRELYPKADLDAMPASHLLMGINIGALVPRSSPATGRTP